MQVNAIEVQSIINTKLAEAGLLALVDQGHQRYTDFPEGLLVELAITDASRKEDFEEAMKSIQESLKSSGIEIQVLIRPIWIIESTEYAGPSRSADGGIRTAVAIGVTLLSGTERCIVVVNVTLAAIDVIRHRLGIEKFYGHFGWSPDKGDVSRRCLDQVVRSFIKADLSGGGEPLINPVRDLNETDMHSLLGESTAFRDLRIAIHDAFLTPRSKQFVDHLMAFDVNPRDFDQVLPRLADTFGGAFKPGDQFLVSANELYNRLRPAEQELLKCYFFELTSNISQP